MIDLKEELQDAYGLDKQIMVANKYIIEKKIGRGSFGEVYKGFDKDTKTPVAIKIELSKTLKTRALIEGRILKKFQDYDGIPKLYYFGTEGDYNVIVLELLGPNLEDLINYCDHLLSMKTVIMIADQLISRMESIHNRGFIHRDIKSDNFLIGCKEQMNKLYVIDFGLAKRYMHPHTGEHIPVKNHRGLIGTARFASINAHLGIEQSRRDDLQAIGYLLVYLAKGSLPWQKVKAKTQQQKYKKIFEIKDSCTPESLCDGLPGIQKFTFLLLIEEFVKYLIHVKRLEFEERPDYTLYKSLFQGLLAKQDLHNDMVFDWMIPANQRKSYRRQIKKKFKTAPAIATVQNNVNLQSGSQEQQDHEFVQKQNEINNIQVSKEDHPIEQAKYESAIIDHTKKGDLVADHQEFNSSQSHKNAYNNTTTNSNQEEERKGDQTAKCILENSDINAHIMQKTYMNPDHHYLESPCRLEVIQERYDEITPYEKSEIILRLGQGPQSEIFMCKINNAILQQRRRKQTEQQLYVDKEIIKQKNFKPRKCLSHDVQIDSNDSIGDAVQPSYQESGDEGNINLPDEGNSQTNQVYQFNINLVNPLQTEKSNTPSPVKSRTLDDLSKHTNGGFGNMFFVQQQDDQPDKEKVLPRIKVEKRQFRNSVDIVRTRQNNNKDSSMFTEYENASAFMNVGQKQHDMSSSNDTPIFHATDQALDGNNQQQKNIHENENDYKVTEKDKVYSSCILSEDESLRLSIDRQNHTLERKKSCLIF